ncbi:hypothetical protein [Pseudomonas caspiana]|uniref:Halovibrin HvnA n=1 Tax=Pseudomonas caspiana TaxID=1451454 RepID=A0A1Y3P0L6_9PSED|nr:hypothetical protein [Pseudomonas caspiana]OUM72292.1 hypothetical protein AUC60_19290 [Pseudomonas caspiana]
MTKLHTLAFSLALAGCTSAGLEQTPSADIPIVKGMSLLGLGEATAEHLIKRYNDVATNCGAVSKPAFLCNGVIIRGTNYSPTRHSWDNSPANHTSGGVSFSYLRRDSKYTKLAYDYDNGYVFLPILYSGDKIQPEILCAFPIDAGTSARAEKGCGAYSGVAGSGPCQSQGIYTPLAWYNHYRAGASSRAHQCGFNVRDALNDGATAAFDAMIKGMALINVESFNTQNELRLAVWQDGLGRVLPLEAFFYVNSIPAGLSDAQNDQRDFKNMTGISLPIISLWLPRTPADQASFKYLPTDQVVIIP